MSQLWERKPIDDAALSVVVLVESSSADALKQTLTELQKTLSERGKPYEVLVPCAASSISQLEPALSACHSARCVSCDDANFGQGSAMRAAIAVANHPLLFVLPAGYPSNQLTLFLKEINLVDLVCGSRKSTERRWRWRQFFSAAYQLYGLWMQDPQCPMRLYRKEIFDRLPIQSNGAFAQIEILAKANFQSRLMTDVPVDGPVSDAPRTSRDFWKVLQNPDFGPPPEKTVEKAAKPIISTQAPEARA